MNRKRVLWPLLLAAAFSLGVLVAQVQAGAIFLPLVARASTGQETPTPTGTVRVVSVHYDALKQGFYGELVNETACTVHVPRVYLYLLDADGLPVADNLATLKVRFISPGERMPFHLDWGNLPPAWDSNVIAIALTWSPIERLTVERPQLVEGE